MKTILLKILLALSAYFAPIQSILIAVLALYTIDLVTGVRKSYLNKKRISSFRLRHTVSKAVNYFLFIVAAHITDESLTWQSLHLAKIAGAYCGLTEFWSICENLNIDKGRIKELIAKVKK
jgi:phage-related holin